MPFIVTDPATEVVRQLGPYRASGGARPGGLESRLWCNGLVLNEQNAYDRYYVKSIDGLFGADIIDSREPKVNADGEESYDTRLGGKTVTITGRIESHNLDVMRDMEQNLQSAFPHDYDYPIVFDRTSLRREGLARNALADKNFCVNPSVETNLSGYIAGSGSACVLTRTTGFYKDFNGGNYYTSIIYHPGTSLRLMQYNEVAGIAITNGQYVQVGIDVYIPDNWSGGDVRLAVRTFHGVGIDSTATLVPELTDNIASETIRGRWQRIWQTFRYEDATDGNKITVDLFAQGSPSDGDEIRVDAQMIRVVADSSVISSSYFDGDSSGWRWEGTPFISASSPDAAAYRQDVFITGRRVDKLGLRDEQTNQWFNREFQIPFRLSDPRIYSTLSKSVSSVPGALTTLYPKNHGNYKAPTRLHIAGPWTNFAIINTTLLDGETVARRFSFTGSIPVGGYFDWDEKESTLIDNTGTRRDGLVDSSANGFVLGGGTNVLTLAGTGLTGTSQVTVSYEDTWI